MRWKFVADPIAAKAVETKKGESKGRTKTVADPIAAKAVET